MIEDIKRMSDIFDAALPPYAEAGPVHAYFKHHTEFSLCAFFGRMDIFQKRRFNAAASSESENDDFAHVLRDLKRQSVTDEARAFGMLAVYKMAKRKPVSEAQKKETDHRFGYILKNMPSTEEFVENYFTEQRSSLNLSAKSPYRNLYRGRLPDETLSTLLSIGRINPKMSLISADISGNTFEHDYCFFEDANFRGADLSHTEWDITTTSIKGALLEGANLAKAQGLTNEYVATAYIDGKTTLPPYLNRAKIEKIHQSLNIPAAKDFTDLELRYMPKPKVKAKPEPDIKL